MACGDGATPVISPYDLDDVLRLNHVQAKGTHNSYHIESSEPVDDSHRYTHAALDVQLESQGVRQFELDLHLSAQGEFEVFHLPGVDEETTCRKFVQCLQIVKTWSDANPWHMPIVFWLEPKDLDFDWATEDYVEFLDKHADLEAEIESIWPPERLLVPDEVRGDYPTLPEAIQNEGWPALGALRGHATFVLLDAGRHRDRYVASNDNLSGRTMFVGASTTTQAFAAFFKINNANQDSDRVKALAAQGFIITSNVDSPERDDTYNSARMAGSLQAGAHFLSSDIPVQLDSRGYFAEVPQGSPARCNPVAAPAECRAEQIESPTRRRAPK